MNARVNEKQVVGRMGLAAGMIVCERYRIQGEVGRGATSVIHAALDIATGVPLALKVLHPRAAANATAVERFLAEARVLARLRHPSIVQVFDYGLLEDGRPFMVMEFLCGRTLQALLEHEGPLDWSRARPLLLSACAALQAVHDAGVVHRDVKPQNLFVLDDERAPNAVKVLDFGLARDPHEPFTAEGVGLESSDYLLLGTPGFMAPEQVTSSDVDERADVYALGVTMFSMLTGRLPFVSNHPVKQMAEHLYVEPPRPRSLNPSVPAAVERVLLRAIAKDPTRRIPSMRAFRRELEVLDDEGDAYPPLLVLRQVIEEPARQIDENADAELGDAAPGQVVDDDPTPFGVASQPDPREPRRTTGRRVGLTLLSVGLLACAFATTSFGPGRELAREVAKMAAGVRTDALERPAAAPWRPSALAVVPDGERATTTAAPTEAEPATESARAPARRVFRRHAPARVVATPVPTTTTRAPAPDPDEKDVEATPAATEAGAVEAPHPDPSQDSEPANADAPAAEIEAAPAREAALEPAPEAPQVPNEPPTAPSEAADDASSPQ